MFNVNNINVTRLTSDVFLVSLLLTLNIFHIFSGVFIVVFEQVNFWWEEKIRKMKKNIEMTKNIPNRHLLVHS